MEIQQYLLDRITYLKTVEMDYFNKAHDENEQKLLRQSYREFSNEFYARRSELEMLQKSLMGENKISAQGSDSLAIHDVGQSSALSDGTQLDKVKGDLTQAIGQNEQAKKDFACDWVENGFIEKCEVECSWCKHWNSEI